MSKQISQEALEKRLQSISTLYATFGEVFDKAWAVTPDFPGKEQKGQWIKDVVLQDKELKALMDGFQRNRPPKFMLAGRTGVGKSSLINALCGAYRAYVSDAAIGTANTEPYDIQRNGETILQVLDTRGIAERSPIDGQSAEQALKNAVFQFGPDIMLLLFNITLRDNSAMDDVKEILKLRREYYKRKGIEIPVIAVLTRTDTLPPERERLPAKYSANKKRLIEDKIKIYKDDFHAWGFYPEAVVAVSSSIDWGLSNEELSKLTPGEIEKLVPKEDCRYHIDELITVITSNLPSEAAMGFAKVAQLDAVLASIARRITTIFAGIAGLIAATPIPFADMPILWGLEVTMVTLIAAVGGETLSPKAAGKFLLSVAGIVGVGFLAQQVSRFLNAIVPGGGAACGAGIAAGTMRLLGEAAIRYYIQHEPMGKVRKKAKEELDDLRASNA